jgi:thiamine-phosphate pyrophosphorylase
VVAVCRNYGARCLINDSFEVAAASGADGVHLGATDPNPQQAREILGTTAIIGVTAHNSAEAAAALALPVDYIGVGPYRFTTTKHDLSPLLGLSGVVRLCSEIKSARPELLVVAVGGVTFEDCPALQAGGIDGVAMSGALLRRAKTEGWLKSTVSPDQPNSELQR